MTSVISRASAKVIGRNGEILRGSIYQNGLHNMSIRFDNLYLIAVITDNCNLLPNQSNNYNSLTNQSNLSANQTTVT